MFGIGHDVQLRMSDNVTCYYINRFNVILPKLEYTISFVKNADDATGNMQIVKYKIG